MSDATFTLEILPSAWYALANLPKDDYDRIQRGLALVAENAAHAPPHPEHAPASGGFVTLDGYLARYELVRERRCVVVLAVEPFVERRVRERSSRARHAERRRATGPALAAGAERNVLAQAPATDAAAPALAAAAAPAPTQESGEA